MLGTSVNLLLQIFLKTSCTSKSVYSLKTANWYPMFTQEDIKEQFKYTITRHFQKNEWAEYIKEHFSSNRNANDKKQQQLLVLYT